MCRIVVCRLLVCAAVAACGLLVTSRLPVGAQEAGALFAPGVLTTIEPEVLAKETVSVHDIVELRAEQALEREPEFDTVSRTLYAMAEDVRFRREVWCLELAFKPLRMVYADVPQSSGKMQRKLLWYMVYRVRNTGVAIGPVEQPDGSFSTADVAGQPLRFIPQFVLTSQDRDRTGERIRKSYLDRLVPAAMAVIQRRELPQGELLDSVQVAEQLLQPEDGRAVGGVWGVAIWEDVDPAIDFLSVYVGGLSNAYRWKDAPEGFRPGDPAGKGRKFSRKTLQLNFWRPGDTLAEHEQEIRFGVAPGYAEYYGTSEGVAYRWLYR